MDLETFLTNISQALPQFETRFVIFLAFVILIVLINLICFSKAVRSLNWRIILSIILTTSIVFILSSTFYTRTIPQEAGILLSAISAAFLITINAIVFIARKKKYKIMILQMRLSKRIKMFIKASFYVFDGLLIASTVLLVVVTIFARPYAVYSIPEVGSYLQSADQPITVRFSLPVNQDQVELHISPEVRGQWVFNDSAINSPLRDEVKFIPEESFYPDSKIVIYITKLTRMVPGGAEHEQSIEMFAPKSPLVKNSDPTDGGKNFPINKDIELEFDAPTGNFVNINYEVTPKIEFSVITISPTKQAIHPTESLAQDQKYLLTAYRQLRSYSVDGNRDIKVGDTETILTETFTTVSTPNIDSYEPQGDNVDPTKAIKVNFQEEMDPTSVKQNLTITPDLLGEITWTDEKSFVFTPTQPMPKDTKYEFRFLKGTLNKYGGKTKDDIVISFETAGKIEATSILPANGSSGLNVTGIVISVTFNQNVDHESAQQHFSISPAAAGTFSWNGNQMNYSISAKLAYSTRYNFSISPGVKAIYGIDSDTEIPGFFVTKSNVFILNVPQYYQPIGSFICNVVAARMVLGYRGINRSDYDVEAGIGFGSNPNSSWVDGYGTHWDPMASYINSQGLAAEVKHGWNIADMAREVEAGHPVILWWWNRYSAQYTFNLGGATAYNGMHSEVVVGFVGDASNPTSIITNDPWRGRLYYTPAQFNSTWSYIGNTAIVVR